jgi:hypothetical protein
MVGTSNEPGVTHMTDMTTAKTILEQLGGGRFIAMTGAKDLVGGASDLSFRLKPCDYKKKIAGKAITHVRITLTDADDYKVEALNCSIKTGIQVLATETNVYCDTLQDAFLRMTGLMTRFGQ